MRIIDFLLGAAAVVSVAAAPVNSTTSNTTSPCVLQRRKSKFTFTGINESGAEFGNTALPGQLGKDYTWPVHSTIDVCLLYSLLC